MGKTYRRTNAKKSHHYVDDWKRKYELGFDPTYSKKLLVKNDEESRKERGYWHTDRYKPASSKLLRLSKKESNTLSRSKARNDIDKIKKLNIEEIENFMESEPRIHKRNLFKWIWVY